MASSAKKKNDMWLQKIKNIYEVGSGEVLQNQKIVKDGVLLFMATELKNCFPWHSKSYGLGLVF